MRSLHRAAITMSVLVALNIPTVAFAGQKEEIQNIVKFILAETICPGIDKKKTAYAGQMKMLYVITYYGIPLERVTELAKNEVDAMTERAIMEDDYARDLCAYVKMASNRSHKIRSR